MNAPLVYEREAYTVTDLVSHETWLLARVRLCNGTLLILNGEQTRMYASERRCRQAWDALLGVAKERGWDMKVK